MKTKFLLPVLAMIFAMGMSFTTVNKTVDPIMDYIQTDTGVFPIQEVDCESGNKQCRAQLQLNGPEYLIFDDPSLSIPKIGSGKVFRLY